MNEATLRKLFLIKELGNTVVSQETLEKNHKCRGRIKKGKLHATTIRTTTTATTTTTTKKAMIMTTTMTTTTTKDNDNDNDNDNDDDNDNNDDE